jgi:Na+-driven multidrug efflux pump
MASNYVKAFVIVLFILIFAFLTFPHINSIIGDIGVSSDPAELPLTRSFFALAPYGAFAAFIYFAYRKTHK